MINSRAQAQPARSKRAGVSGPLGGQGAGSLKLAAVETVTARAGDAGLAALVNNAGVGIFGPLEPGPLESIRQQFEVNVTGQVAVSQAFLPLLRKTHGRIVMIGSIGDRAAMPFGEPLGASKADIALMAEALRQELAPWDVKVILIRPASIQTEAVGKFEADAEKAIASFPDEGRALYEDTCRRMVTAALLRLRRGSSPDVVADTIAGALAARRPRTRYLVGKDSRALSGAPGPGVRRDPPPLARPSGARLPRAREASAAS
jgi:NAD(P)-dependent dehydrogenase (short-subunit alcohol dehydrogenase family)